jgi:hypothetical protein
MSFFVKCASDELVCSSVIAKAVPSDVDEGHYVLLDRDDKVLGKFDDRDCQTLNYGTIIPLPGWEWCLQPAARGLG